MFKHSFSEPYIEIIKWNETLDIITASMNIINDQNLEEGGTDDNSGKYGDFF